MAKMWAEMVCQIDMMFQKMSLFRANQISQQMRRGGFLALIRVANAHQDSQTSFTDVPCHQLGL